MELDYLERLLEGAAAGHGEFVLCTGPAGVGKTRLAEELSTIADSLGVPVAWAVAPDLNSAPAYSLWQRVFASAADLGLDHPEAGPVPESFWSLVVGPEAVTRVAADDGTASDRFVIFEAAHQRLTRLAHPHGLVVVLDDLHLADIDSLALLVHMVRHLRGSRLLIVATVRDLGGVDDSTRIINGLLAEMGTSLIELGGLGADAVQAILTDAGIESSGHWCRLCSNGLLETPSW